MPMRTGCEIERRPGWPVAAAMCLLAGIAGGWMSPAFATGISPNSNLTLICPSGGLGEPQLGDPKTGKTFAITDPQIKAVAAKACNPPILGGGSGSVNIVNSRNVPIFVGFTTIDHNPGPISWGNGCTKTGTGAIIASGATCIANVTSNGVASRFCASLTQVPSDCFNAQVNHQTMVETNFEPASNPGCFNKGNCVWFDISVIPSTCTDTLWKSNQCAGTGGASYNLPVSVACNGNTIYTCQGPASTKYGTANYPSMCGNPNAICQGSPNCLNAYFYPMFDPPENQYQPNTACLSGQTLTVNFLAGQ